MPTDGRARSVVDFVTQQRTTNNDEPHTRTDGRQRISLSAGLPIRQRKGAQQVCPIRSRRRQAEGRRWLRIISPHSLAESRLLSPLVVENGRTSRTRGLRWLPLSSLAVDVSVPLPRCVSRRDVRSSPCKGGYSRTMVATAHTGDATWPPSQTPNMVCGEDGYESKRTPRVCLPTPCVQERGSDDMGGGGGEREDGGRWCARAT